MRPSPGVLDALRMGADEQARLAGAFADAKRRVYLATVEDLLGRPSGQLSPDIDAALRLEAEEHAASVVATYNRELENFIDGLSDMPDVDMLLAVEEWSISRGDSKHELVAVTEAYAPHADATVATYLANLTLTEFDFGGHGDDPPDCPICRALVAGNPWPLEAVVQIGVPHINCRQEWHDVGGGLPADATEPLLPAGIVGRDTLLHRAGNRAAAVQLIQEMS